MNTRDTIDRTILSVVTQSGDFRIRYHVQDGGSTDGNYERALWWRDQVMSGQFPVQCIEVEFTCAQEGDVGMYDAIIRGYAKMSPHGGEWLTWINADDVLVPGALAFAAAVDRQFEPKQVSWFGGAAYLTRNNDFWTLVSYDRHIPTDAIRAGMCDNIHWPFVQQEGTFYRKWLWDTIDAHNSIRTMKVAGDWNIWRLMARQANLVQTAFPLGCFSVREGQLSGKFRSTYHDEMDALVPVEERQKSLEKLGATGYVVRRRFKSRYGDGQLSILEDFKTNTLEDFYKQVFKKPLPVKYTGPSEKLLTEGSLARSARFPLLPPVDKYISVSGNIVAYDHGWQRPACTEEHAYRRISGETVPDGVTYVAYPWATLIDKLHFKTKDAGYHLRRFRQFCNSIPASPVRVTVCQQIFMREHLDLLEAAGITHVYWAHATPADVTRADANEGGIKILPFPLYPVQVPERLPAASIEADTAARPHLFSFIGAKPDQWYPIQTRAWIVDHLTGDKRGFVVGRDGWFYNRVVYDQQVLNRVVDDKSPAVVAEKDQASQFRQVLQDSVFALCPAGTGPNSIRLWEAIGAGAIPVIQADTWAPPGNRRLWEAAAVFAPETEDAVKALPAQLAAIASNPDALAAKRQAMRQIWDLYGPQSFVHDIKKFMLDHAGITLKPKPVARVRDKSLADLVERLQDRLPLHQRDAQLLLRSVTKRLASGQMQTAADLDDVKDLRPMVALARQALPADNAALRHFDTLIAEPRDIPSAPVGQPMINHGVAPRVCLFGRHSHRTPLSYQPFRAIMGDRIAFVAKPDTADLIVTGFNRDIEDNADAIFQAQRTNPRAKLLVMSEEPLWDTLWSGGFVERNRKFSSRDLQLSYTFLNHENSDIFVFDKLPYMPLTDDSPLFYGPRLRKFLDASPEDMLAHWERTPVRAAFFAEHREGSTYEKSDPRHDFWGLCVYRTQVARKMSGEGMLRIGKGWQSEARRQDLPDWHLDKLATLGSRVRICSAFENTHQRHYISEKIFDAFATGGIPTYFASPKHRVKELIDPEAMINTFGMSVEKTVATLESFHPDRHFARAWLATAKRLYGLFTDMETVVAERQRISEAALKWVFIIS